MILQSNKLNWINFPKNMVPPTEIETCLYKIGHLTADWPLRIEVKGGNHKCKEMKFAIKLLQRYFFISYTISTL